MFEKKSGLTDEEWNKKYFPIIRKIRARNLAKGIKPKSSFQIAAERGLLKTFEELPSDIQGFLEGENDDMFIASW
jgi:hypothetical protein